MPTKRATTTTNNAPGRTTLFDLDALPRAVQRLRASQAGPPELMRLLRGIFYEVPRTDLENDEYEWVSVSRTALLKLADFIDYDR